LAREGRDSFSPFRRGNEEGIPCGLWASRYMGLGSASLTQRAMVRTRCNGWFPYEEGCQVGVCVGRARLLAAAGTQAGSPLHCERSRAFDQQSADKDVCFCRSRRPSSFSATTASTTIRSTRWATARCARSFPAPHWLLPYRAASRLSQVSLAVPARTFTVAEFRPVHATGLQGGQQGDLARHQGPQRDHVPPVVNGSSSLQ